MGADEAERRRIRERGPRARGPRRLRSLAAESGGDLAIHLVGHSAGAHHRRAPVCSPAAAPATKVATCTLYAPACTLPFALDHFAAPIDAGVLARGRFAVHALSDARERDDGVAPPKSLLYLVSRAFTRAQDPLAGLASAYGNDALTKCQVGPALAHRRRARWQQWYFGGARRPASRAGRPRRSAGLALVNAHSR